MFASAAVNSQNGSWQFLSFCPLSSLKWSCLTVFIIAEDDFQDNFDAQLA